jgi:hypothetical protein
VACIVAALAQLNDSHTFTDGLLIDANSQMAVYPFARPYPPQSTGKGISYVSLRKAEWHCNILPQTSQGCVGFPVSALNIVD